MSAAKCFFFLTAGGNKILFRDIF